MPFYTGKGDPKGVNFEFKEFEGLYISSCGNFFSSIPFTPESENEMRESQKQMRRRSKKQDWKNRIKNFRNSR